MFMSLNAAQGSSLLFVLGEGGSVATQQESASALTSAFLVHVKFASDFCYTF